MERSEQTALLVSRVEDRSDVLRVVGEQNREGRPASAEAEADATCRQLSPSPHDFSFSDIGFRPFSDTKSARKSAFC